MKVDKKQEIKPFVKWAGGKSQLLDAIEALVPKDFNRYVEPFLGGGAVLFDLQPKEAVVNDLNSELITAYKVISTNKQALIRSLKEKVRRHNESEAKTYYGKIRENKPKNDVEVASRFIYLNKTGFNGLYRVNSKGEFNVPFGKKEVISNSTLFSPTNLTRIENYLKESNVKIKNTDFQEIIDSTKKGDFIFCDSPYDNSFASYQKEGFGKEEHKRLANAMLKAHERGVKFMITNHDTELIRDLYGAFEFYSIPVNRFINSNAQKRQGQAEEVIICNYPINSKQKKEFKKVKFYKQLKPTSHVLNDYVKWDKINESLKGKELYINDLNLLHANTKEDFQKRFEMLYENRSSSFEILPYLLANRNTNFTYWLENGTAKTFTHLEKDVVWDFLNDSGLLKNLFLNPTYNNVSDYIVGLEVGLTSNDKKNSTGKWMSENIKRLLSDYGIEYKTEVPYRDVIPANRTKDKVFDFVFSYDGTTYCTEVNFFNSNGSKINSESIRFIDLNNKLKEYSDIEFVWISDGVGLKASKSSIDNAMNQIDNFFNLTTFDEFLKELTQ